MVFVSDTGSLYGNAAGSAVVRAASINGLYQECAVTVVKPGKGVTGIVITEPGVSVDEGKTVTLTVRLTPSSAQNKTIIWASTDPSIASVDGRGKVAGLLPGAAIITATASSGVSARCSVIVNSLAVSQVVLKRNRLEVDEGKSVSISVSVLPRNARIKAVTWASSDPSIATVTPGGKITAYAPGTVQIIATAHNGVSASCTLVVRSLAVSQVVLKKSYLEVDEGKTTSLSASVLPKNARFKKVDWSSSDPSVASVSPTGKIRACKPGTIQIIATAHNGISASCTLVVRSLAVTGISLGKTALTVRMGRTVTLRAALLPKNTPYKAIVWISSNPAIAAVSDSGKISGVQPGTAVITAVSHNGLAASCTVTVE